MRSVAMFACQMLLLPIFIFAGDLDLSDLAAQYEEYKLAPEDLRKMKHTFVVDRLQDIAALSPDVHMDPLGHSVEGRSINMLRFGSGETRLLLWSQMHGDEPTATAALLAIFNYLANNPDHELVHNIKNNLSLHAIVMLNPDGAEVFKRRNAQDIDINRDARLLQTPEGKILKTVADSLKPDFGYNLHNMAGREMVSDSRKLLNVAFMAPPFNAKDDDSPNRIRAKRLVVFMKQILDQFIPGHISIYKADYMPRAFGDAMQNWGISTVLIESAIHDHEQPDFLVKMNFISLLASFDAIAKNKLAEIDAAKYDQIPLEGRLLFDLLIHDILIYNGTGISPFRGDIGINVYERIKNDSLIREGKIVDLGDLTTVTGGRKEIDGNGLAVMPGLIGFGDTLQVRDLMAQGVTRIIAQPDSLNINEAIPPTSFKIQPQTIKQYTWDRAQAAGLNCGVIKRRKKADLVLFKLTDQNTFTADRIQYVIKNGRIVIAK